MRSSLDREVLHGALVRPGSPWRAVTVHAELDSTNAELARSGALWEVVVADHQTAGRGRLGRSWEDVPGATVAVSALLPMPETGPGWLPLVTGLALHRAIADVTGLVTGLKWPNDVLAEADAWRKVCGVLCEVVPAGGVVGAGVNVSQERDELPVETATSLRLCGAGDVRREALITAYLSHLASLHRALTGPYAGRLVAQDAYRSACLTIGAEVDLHVGPAGAPGRIRRLVATGIDAQGRLTVQGPGGEEAIAAGDVVHVRLHGGATADGDGSPPGSTASES
jgi:BirA family transcriptional regulator, biotin operon repressor / biotin---[acetyl-CoA-carboxylase] ligase